MSRYFTANKLAYWERSATYLKGGCIVPVTWELDLTTACNQACPGCSGNRFFNVSLSPDEATRIVKEIADVGGEGLILTGGGDPTMNREGLLAVLGILPMLLLTHGELFDEELARVVLPHLEGIRFSLDAYDDESAVRWRGITPERWQKTLGNIRRAVAIKRELGLTLPIGTAYLTDRERNAGIPHFADLSKALGADYAQYRPMLWSTANQQQPDWDYPVFEELYGRAESHYPDMVTCSRQKYDRMANGTTGRPYERCHAGRFTSTIGADGKLYFCCHTRYMPSFSFGDLKTEKLADILRTERIENIRDRMTMEVCPLLCRGDSINRVITDMQEKKPNHLMFL